MSQSNDIQRAEPARSAAQADAESIEIARAQAKRRRLAGSLTSAGLFLAGLGTAVSMCMLGGDRFAAWSEAAKSCPGCAEVATYLDLDTEAERVEAFVASSTAVGVSLSPRGGRKAAADAALVRRAWDARGRSGALALSLSEREAFERLAARWLADPQSRKAIHGLDGEVVEFPAQEKALRSALSKIAQAPTRAFGLAELARMAPALGWVGGELGAELAAAARQAEDEHSSRPAQAAAGILSAILMALALVIGLRANEKADDAERELDEMQRSLPRGGRRSRGAAEEASWRDAQPETSEHGDVAVAEAAIAAPAAAAAESAKFAHAPGVARIRS